MRTPAPDLPLTAAACHSRLQYHRHVSRRDDAYRFPYQPLIFRSQTEDSNLLKPTSKLYRQEVFVSSSQSWPGIGAGRAADQCNDCSTRRQGL